MQVVFVHKPSGMLIATDLIWNYPGSGTPKGTQAWKFGMDRVYLPFYKNFMIKDKGNCPPPPDPHPPTDYVCATADHPSCFSIWIWLCLLLFGASVSSCV